MPNKKRGATTAVGQMHLSQRETHAVLRTLLVFSLCHSSRTIMAGVYRATARRLWIRPSSDLNWLFAIQGVAGVGASVRG